MVLLVRIGIFSVIENDTGGLVLGLAGTLLRMPGGCGNDAMLMDFRTSLSAESISAVLPAVVSERNVGTFGVDLAEKAFGDIADLMDCEGVLIASLEGVCRLEGCRTFPEKGVGPLRDLKLRFGGGIAERGVMLVD